jgi:hypothetical protein
MTNFTRPLARNLIVVRQSRPYSIPQDVAVIIRSAGERTKDLCYELLCSETPRENIVVINERPFTRALQQSFELGIDLARPWTLCVDADMLSRRRSVQSLVSWAGAADDTVFQIQGNLFDKILGGPRWGSPRLYRTSLLPKALSFIPSDGVTLRPETFVLNQMQSAGYPSLHKNQTLGLHDFEQYYRDIYRKAFLHAHKHQGYMTHLEPLWQRLAEYDADYQVALWGLHAGRLSNGIVALDVRFFPQDLSSLLHAHGWQEKNELDLTRGIHADVDTLIIEFGRTRALADLPRRADPNCPKTKR